MAGAVILALSVTVVACGVRPIWLVGLEGVSAGILCMTGVHLWETERRKLRTKNYKMWLRALKTQGRKLWD